MDLATVNDAIEETMPVEDFEGYDTEDDVHIPSSATPVVTQRIEESKEGTISSKDKTKPDDDNGDHAVEDVFLNSNDKNNDANLEADGGDNDSNDVADDDEDEVEVLLGMGIGTLTDQRKKTSRKNDDDDDDAVVDIDSGVQQPLSVGELGKKLFKAGSQIGTMEMSKLQTSYMMNQQVWLSLVLSKS